MKTHAARSLTQIVFSMVMILIFEVLTAQAASAPSSAATRAPKGILKFAVPNFDAEVFDPMLHTQQPEYQYLVYPSLVGGDLHAAQMDTRTGLAYKWETKDNKTWTFYLRKDAKWWDGTHITASDVKFSIPRNWKPGARTSPPGELKQLLGGDKGEKEVDQRIQIIDDYTIRFNLTEPAFRFPVMLSRCDQWSMIVPKHWVDKNGEAALAKGEMGAGPYKLVEVVAKTMQRLKAWPEHPFLQPIYEEVQIEAVPQESTRIAMLKTGKVDIAEVSYEQVPDLEKAGFKIIKKPTGVLWTILFTEPWKDPVLAKKEVRKAIMMAIDKETFNKAFFNGTGDYINDGGNVGQVIDPMGKVTRAPIPTNLDEAKRIIAREVPKGYKLRFFGVIRGPVSSEHIQAIAGMLQKVGFDVETQIMDYSNFRTKWGDATLGAGIYLKDGRKFLSYLPSLYAASPAQTGRYSVIPVPPPPSIKVNPAIPMKDLETLRSMDDVIDRLVVAKNWNEYWQAYSDLMDRCIDQIAPGSGFLFTNRTFAARPGILPKWDVNLSYQGAIGIDELAIYPPEFEDVKYHPVEYEGKR